MIQRFAGQVGVSIQQLNSALADPEVLLAIGPLIKLHADLISEQATFPWFRKAEQRANALTATRYIARSVSEVAGKDNLRFAEMQYAAEKIGACVGLQFAENLLAKLRKGTATLESNGCYPVVPILEKTEGKLVYGEVSITLVKTGEGRKWISHELRLRRVLSFNPNDGLICPVG